ncbi:hypothetical protein RND81_08G122100 [Saponaria officinalis]|uniref:Uncharacterized protein n=1 Tax=Saponaria officinalis TaxID=3572 RepID=A0AAW1J9V7_SAPOF
MCGGAKDWIPSPPTSTERNLQSKQHQSRRCKVRVQWLVIRKRFEGTKTGSLELKNLQLYLENRSILEENERLRQKAIRLRQENEALLSEYQNKVRTR